ncbi:unnamed protein product [Notodromas monacha]|uniref:T-complex protein 1 subunit theta n=1 Tax=Notodromas monacha TaxID=399045 RepID=A0A7R9BXU5_9CRUS|nr:unnamed protein product [Notodromas monacha]CAG0922118.1 unnamed protein product [Notodromas monacha]
MAMHVPKGPGFASMLKEGSKFFAGIEEAVIRNIEACKEFTNTVKTAYGPNGMNKIIINHFGKLFLTSDCGTIVRELEVNHPAAKMIVQASTMQEQEVGDGTNFVVILAGALLSNAEDLVRKGLKPVEVAKGYELALKKCLDILPSLEVEKVENVKDLEKVKRAIRASLSSKQNGNEDFLADLVSKACVSVVDDKNSGFNVDNVRVCKILGGGLYGSQVLQGMVFKRGVETTITKAEKAKVAVYTCAVDSAATETKGTVLIKSAAELKTFSRGEESLLETQIKAIADAGVKVIVSGGKIADMALHYLNKYEIMGVRLQSKFDLRRLAKSVGAIALPKMVAPTPEEAGFCDHVYVDELGESSIVVFRMDSQEARLSTIVIRGSTDNMMDDVERAIDDAINNFKVLARDGRLVPGAGAVEMELSCQIAKYANTCHGLEQYAIHKFAASLEAFPRTLAANSGLGVTKAIAALIASHGEGKAASGLNVLGENDSPLLDAVEAGILDPLLTKQWGMKYDILQFATSEYASKFAGYKTPVEMAKSSLHNFRLGKRSQVVSVDGSDSQEKSSGFPCDKDSFPEDVDQDLHSNVRRKISAKQRKRVDSERNFLALVESGSLVEIGREAFFVVCRNGREDLVNLLLNFGCDLNARNEFGETPLHVAAAEGQRGIVELMLKKRANTSNCDNAKMTPLHVAVERGHQSIVKMLLHAGSGGDLEVVNERGLTPWDTAIKSNDRSMLKLLQDWKIRHSHDKTEDGLQILQAHGIRYLSDEPSPGNSVISSLLSLGRKFTLTDVGKELLKRIENERPIDPKKSDLSPSRDDVKDRGKLRSFRFSKKSQPSSNVASNGIRSPDCEKSVPVDFVSLPGSVVINPMGGDEDYVPVKAKESGSEEESGSDASNDEGERSVESRKRRKKSDEDHVSSKKRTRASLDSSDEKNLIAREGVKGYGLRSDPTALETTSKISRSSATSSVVTPNASESTTTPKTPVIPPVRCSIIGKKVEEFMVMNDEDIGRLQDEAVKRKERLLSLKRKKDKTGDGENKAEPAPLPSPMFRSYRPIDESLKDSSAPKVKPAEIIEEVEDQVEAGKARHVMEQVDLTSLAPRKPDWDLKRDVAKKLEKLERQTQRAIAELIRDRLLAEEGRIGSNEDEASAGEVDLNVAVSVGAQAEMLQDDDDDDDDES